MSDWRDNLRSIEPYVPGEQPDFPDMIKLNTNENPYPPSPKVREALQSFDEDALRLYPDPNSQVLADALAGYYGVDSSQIFMGVGSDDVLAIAFMTFFNSAKPILFPDITYSFYDVWAELFRIPYSRPVVIIDEAYVDFGQATALELTREFENVLIVRTYSKSRSLAGMRIGYAIGNEELIRAMNDVRYSYNSYPMTRLSVALGAAALEDEVYFQETLDKVLRTREWTKGEFPFRIHRPILFLLLISVCLHRRFFSIYGRNTFLCDILKAPELTII